MTVEPPSLTLDPNLAAVLELPTRVSRMAAAQRLAEIAGVGRPNQPATQRVLSEIVAAIQRDVIDHPDVRMDRGVAADTALGRGCLRAGRDAVLETEAELGKGTLDCAIREALDVTIAPALARRGAINLVGEPKNGL